MSLIVKNTGLACYHIAIMSTSNKRVLVAMSGGVDSSVAAALLLRAGYEVVGCFMRLGSPGESIDQLQEDENDVGIGSCQNQNASNSTKKDIRIAHQGCCSINDAQDARLVAAKLDIPFYVCNFKKDFGTVIDYFVNEYNAGRTPNPCIRCNDWLKFGKLHSYAQQIDAQYIASGHYARIDRSNASNNKAPRLLRGVDKDKDQSYVLFGVPSDRLHEMLLPIGQYHKSEIRQLAQQMDLPVFDKPDSQEICFVPDNNYAQLVIQKSPDSVKPGPILDSDGKQIGEHPGHQHFTIGQRRGIGVATGIPIYVISRDPVNNSITVGSKDMLLSTGCIATDTNWLLDDNSLNTARDIWLPCYTKIRYNAPQIPAEFKITSGSNKSNNKNLNLEVRFVQPQFAVAPGQAIVCYDAENPDVVIGGGWIDKAF